MLTCPERIYAMEEFHQIPRMYDTAVRTEVARSVLKDPTGKKDPGEFVRAHTDPRIGLGVFKKNVVAGLELLDKIIFQEQGICLRLHDSILGVCNL